MKDNEHLAICAVFETMCFSVVSQVDCLNIDCYEYYNIYHTISLHNILCSSQTRYFPHAGPLARALFVIGAFENTEYQASRLEQTARHRRVRSIEARSDIIICSIVSNYDFICPQSAAIMATMTEPSRPTTTSRRSFTLPSRLQTTAGESSETDATGAETLFAHSAARVVSFSASKILGLGQGKQDASPLPWASRSERVISLGKHRARRGC